MSQIKDSMNTMLNRYKDFYCGKKKQIELIDKFENAYTSNRTIDWYTKESFLYKVVNRTFRIDDITLWYPFRCYIIDLCKQLEQVHKEQNIQTNLNLYRGQSCMSTDELEYLKSNIGDLFRIHGFLSASKNFDIIRLFLDDVVNIDQFKSVIFEITVMDPIFKILFFSILMGIKVDLMRSHNSYETNR
ncbi:unnamed protein product [Rotaria sordida]|uniref:Uncharacterized protein n=1 Tax=Rotaria sordida TaxID=392033 RepID=A0A815SER9_9BILA|nr:unnamed protein product [Rotaria sordida]